MVKRPEDKELRKRLRELGYEEGGYVYEFHLSREAGLSNILEQIEKIIGKRFMDGVDGHVLKAGQYVKIIPKEELTDTEVTKIKNCL